MVVVTERGVVERREGQTDQCRHYWLIDSPSGPTSKGVCRLCGAQREFTNYLEGIRWDEDRSSDSDAARARIALSISADFSPEEEG